MQLYLNIDSWCLSLCRLQASVLLNVCPQTVHSRSSKTPRWSSAPGLVLKCKAWKSIGWPASPLQTEVSGTRYPPSNFCIKLSVDSLHSVFTSKKLGKAESICSKPSRWPLVCPTPVYKWKQKCTSFGVKPVSHFPSPKWVQMTITSFYIYILHIWSHLLKEEQNDNGHHWVNSEIR